MASESFKVTQDADRLLLEIDSALDYLALSDTPYKPLRVSVFVIAAILTAFVGCSSKASQSAGKESESLAQWEDLLYQSRWYGGF